jgi:hypothetical protein
MSYLTSIEYQTYTGITLETDEISWVTNSLIPEAVQLIEDFIGYSFEASNEARNFHAIKDTQGIKLFFNTWLASAPFSVKLNSVSISSSDYVLLGRGPYYGLSLLASTGLSWADYGDDPDEAIEVTGYWGYSTTPPALIKKACILYVQDSLKNRSGTAVDLQPFLMHRILKLYPPFCPFSRG